MGMPPLHISFDFNSENMLFKNIIYGRKRLPGTNKDYLSTPLRHWFTMHFKFKYKSNYPRPDF